MITNIMLLITFLASFWFILGLNIILLFIIKNNKYKLLLMASSLSDLAIIEPLKKIIAKPRPIGGLINETSFSMPSGHAYTAMVIYGLLTYLVYKHFKKKFIIVSGLIFILLIVYSRIYLGVHDWTDVAVGLILGIMWLSGLIYYTKI